MITKPEGEEGADGAKTPETVAARPARNADVATPERRFHNLHDAAAWIEQNWPAFDLETNHPMTWRAGN